MGHPPNPAEYDRYEAFECAHIEWRGALTRDNILRVRLEAKEAWLKIGKAIPANITFAEPEVSALSSQIGGDHYKNCAIQPVQYIEANGLQFLEGCIVKRITRHDKPTGKGRQDIEKIIHECQLLLELRYGDDKSDT